MLEHLNIDNVKPARVVILGARGFVGAAATKRLTANGTPIAAIGHDDIDLSTDDAAGRLGGLIRADDGLLVIAARAPVKDGDMLVDNIRMMNNVCKALAKVTPAHVVYVSSDAVYADSSGPLNEASCAEPSSLHGAMHLAREVMLKSSTTAPLALLRPSLLYGAADPHNGYGPNRFRRLAMAEQDIVLFGEGEERRDHVYIDDVAELIWRVLARRSRGTLNIATGDVKSFRWIAEHVATMAAKPVAVRSGARSVPMPHNGYRPFDPAATKAAFPDFHYTSLKDGLARAWAGAVKP